MQIALFEYLNLLQLFDDCFIIVFLIYAMVLIYSLPQSVIQQIPLL